MGIYGPEVCVVSLTMLMSIIPTKVVDSTVDAVPSGPGHLLCSRKTVKYVDKSSIIINNDQYIVT